MTVQNTLSYRLLILSCVTMRSSLPHHHAYPLDEKIEEQPRPHRQLSAAGVHNMHGNAGYRDIRQNLDQLSGGEIALSLEPQHLCDAGAVKGCVNLAGSRPAKSPHQPVDEYPDARRQLPIARVEQ
jgi:hypothetical protein